MALTRGTRLRVVVGKEKLLSETRLWKSVLECPTAVKMEVSSRATRLGVSLTVSGTASPVLVCSTPKCLPRLLTTSFRTRDPVCQ